MLLRELAPFFIQYSSRSLCPGKLPVFPEFLHSSNLFLFRVFYIPLTPPPICDFPRIWDSSPFYILQCPQGLTHSIGTQVCGTDAFWLVAGVRLLRLVQDLCLRIRETTWPVALLPCSVPVCCECGSESTASQKE